MFLHMSKYFSIILDKIRHLLYTVLRGGVIGILHNKSGFDFLIYHSNTKYVVAYLDFLFWRDFNGVFWFFIFG